MSGQAVTSDAAVLVAYERRKGHVVCTELLLQLVADDIGCSVDDVSDALHRARQIKQEVCT